MKQNDIILVIDMQNVYLTGQPWACLDTEGAARNIVRIAKGAEGKLDPSQIIFTRYIAPQHPEGAWKDYNRTYAQINADPFLNAMVPGIRAAMPGHPFFKKSTYSAVSVPEIRDAAMHCGRLILTGVVSECCVLSTAFAAIDLGCHVLWIRDAVSGFDVPKEQGAELMLKGLSPVHTNFMSTEQYLQEQE